MLLLQSHLVEENTGEYGKRDGVKERIKRFIEVDRISKKLGYEVIK